MIHSLKTSLTDLIWIAVIVAIGLFLRLDFLFASKFVIDGDEAIVGLMAKHIMEGRGIPIFYYGQSYMGSAEAIFASCVFKVFGVSSIALKSIPLFFSVALIVLIYFIGFELGSRFIARVGGLFLAVGPSVLIIWSAKARGGFIEIVFVGTLAIYLALRWIKSTQPSMLQTMLIALVLGVGWWINNQILYYLLPIGLFMLLRCVRLELPIGARISFCLEHTLAGVAAFLLGSLPFWIYNLEHNFTSFGMFSHASLSEAGSHLLGAFSVALPILLGGRRLWAAHDIFPGATIIALAPVGLLMIYLMFARRKQFGQLLCGKVCPETPIELFVIFVFGALAVFSLSSFGGFVEEPRYLLPLYPALAIVVAASLEVLAGKSRLFAVAFGILLLSLNLMSCYLGGRALPGQPFVYKGERVSVDHKELINWLEQNNIKWVRTNYWIGYRLAFETGEKTRFMMFQEPGQVRIDSYENEGAPVEAKSPFVLVPAQASLVEVGLKTLHIDYRKVKLSNYDVIYDLRPRYHDLEPVPLGGLVVSASDGTLAPALAMDGKLDTRWGSGQPQHPGQEFEIKFGSPKPLRCIRYDIANWRSDYPRLLEIDAKLEDGSSRQLLSADQYLAVRYLADGDEVNDFCFDSVRINELSLIQRGSHPLFDWSIAELQFLK